MKITTACPVMWAALAAALLLLPACRAPRPTHDEPTEAPVPCSTPGIPPVPDSVRRPPPPPDPSPPKFPPQGEAVHAADLHRVDATELVGQARTIARRYDQNAVLIAIRMHRGVVGGLVDVTSDDGVTFDFEWLYYDKAKPPGRDKVENALWVTARAGKFTVMETHAALSLRRSTDPGPDPQCTARAAWAAAVRAGLAENAVVSMGYAARFPGKPGQPYVWTFRVDGHDELRREIDGKTCGVAAPYQHRRR